MKIIDVKNKGKKIHLRSNTYDIRTLSSLPAFIVLCAMLE